MKKVGLTVLEGAALFETALILGILIGGVAARRRDICRKALCPACAGASRRWPGKTAQRRTVAEAPPREWPKTRSQSTCRRASSQFSSGN